MSGVRSLLESCTDYAPPQVPHQTQASIKGKRIIRSGLPTLLRCERLFELVLHSEPPSPACVLHLDPRVLSYSEYVYSSVISDTRLTGLFISDSGAATMPADAVMQVSLDLVSVDPFSKHRRLTFSPYCAREMRRTR